jgi:hypothetical protein
MELDNALDQIAQIHRLMTRTHTFRGYRAVTTLFTACVAIAAAAFQSWWIPDAAQHPFHFVDLWISVAIACLIVVAIEIVDRYRRTDSPLQRQLTIQAIEQFLPVLLVGGLVTLVLCQSAKSSLWLLPGLWSIFFGLGILASRHLLPRPVVFVGFFYLLCGLTCIALFQGADAFSPWLVAVPFGIGQTAAAAILHWKLERQDAAD